MAIPVTELSLFGSNPYPVTLFTGTMELKGKRIVTASNEGWGDVWFSKHNYAYELSKHNEVLFVDPVSALVTH